VDSNYCTLYLLLHENNPEEIRQNHSLENKMDIQKKIEELGLFLPACPKPLASYVPANRIDNLIYVSGQLPSIKGDLGSYVGAVPSSMSPEVGR
jgi:hypothetical protein